jgi:hypothetical protein
MFADSRGRVNVRTPHGLVALSIPWHRKQRVTARRFRKMYGISLSRFLKTPIGAFVPDGDLEKAVSKAMGLKHESKTEHRG